MSLSTHFFIVYHLPHIENATGYDWLNQKGKCISLFRLLVVLVFVRFLVLSTSWISIDICDRQYCYSLGKAIYIFCIVEIKSNVGLKSSEEKCHIYSIIIEGKKCKLRQIHYFCTRHTIWTITIAFNIVFVGIVYLHKYIRIILCTLK